MLRMKTKFMITALSTTLLVSAFSPLSALASPNTYERPNQIVSSAAASPTQVEPYWKVKVAKEALEKLLKALDKADNIELIKKGMRAIGLGKHTKKIDDAVDKMKQEVKWLLEWQEVTMQNLKDKLAGALYDAGLPLSAARLVANVVIEVLF
ncbi:hypothetical protein NLX71_25360 [Paenibacillus sp. MZ04-78.2]|uniref:hypothetical protein n=1 Tax=Paenibacillus sp. MZ04-78.2 TaxID=2962034 RepID=UPI0020B6A612|nr:hypothetical protein [Paenibacillus sp. MZ04-78.2]MCP3776577.1 hypothetical protein [Paenibacillus sp. MZ04-78.2]